MLTYRVSPYLYVNNPEEVGSSVIKLYVLDSKGKKETDLKDKDDPIDAYVNTNYMDPDGHFEDMTESLTDSGVDISYVDTNETAGGFMIEIKIISLKICDLYGQYSGYPTEDSYYLSIITKGKSRIKSRYPLGLQVSFKDQLLKISLPPDKNGTLRPIFIAVSCEGNSNIS